MNAFLEGPQRNRVLQCFIVENFCSFIYYIAEILVLFNPGEKELPGENINSKCSYHFLSYHFPEINCKLPRLNASFFRDVGTGTNDILCFIVYLNSDSVTF